MAKDWTRKTWSGPRNENKNTTDGFHPRRNTSSDTYLASAGGESLSLSFTHIWCVGALA